MWTRFFLILCFPAVSVFSDTLILKNNKTYENVKVRTVGTLVEISFEDGTKQTAPKKFIKNLKLKVVIWKKTENIKDTYEQERARIAEFLIENSTWQPKENEKPQLMILKFKAGSNVTSYKAESLSNLIRTKIINTGMFVVADRINMEKEIEKNKCMSLNCSQEIASRLQVNKLLTGEISANAKGYLVTGEIIDIANKKVEFSESVQILSDDKEEDSIKNFASKIAGGTLEKWEHPINNPQAGVEIVPYVWRSMILPGWGQFEKEQYFRAFFYPILLSFGGVYYKVSLDSYKEKENKYKTWTQYSFFNQSAPMNPYFLYFSEGVKKDANNSAESVNKIAGFLLGVYIINILDAIFTPVPMELKKISVQYNREYSKELNLAGGIYEFSYTVRF